jgi:O-antigen/teichoic acid export membrane protein
MNFQGRNLVASDALDEYSFEQHLSFRIACLGIAMLGLCSCIVLLGMSVENSIVVMVVGVGQSIEYVSETCFGLLQKYDRLDRVSISLMVKGPLCLLLLIMAMHVTHNVVWGVSALAAGRCVVLCCIDLRNVLLFRGSIRLGWNSAVQSKLLRVALPLGVISGLCAANLNIPRYFVEGYSGKTELGIFSVLASLVGAGNLVISALASCRMAGMAKAWVDADALSYRAISAQLVVVSALVGGAGVAIAFLAGSSILSVLFRPEYARYANVLPPVMLAGAASYVVSAQGYALTAARKLMHQVPILAGTAAIITLASWYLVPRKGLIGAAVAWVFGCCFQLACSSYLITHSIARLSAARSAGKGSSSCEVPAMVIAD